MQHRAIAADDLTRGLRFVNPDGEDLSHLAVGANTYTVLIKGADTGGRYALIDMNIPPGGSNVPHRHDFEEMFHVLEGEVQVTVRGESVVAKAGESVNIPALAPHSFVNLADRSTRLLCMVCPAGLEDFFAEFADRVASRTSPAPTLGDAEQAERNQRAFALSPKYGIEILLPGR